MAKRGESIALIYLFHGEGWETQRELFRAKQSHGGTKDETNNLLGQERNRSKEAAAFLKCVDTTQTLAVSHLPCLTTSPFQYPHARDVRCTREIIKICRLDGCSFCSRERADIEDGRLIATGKGRRSTELECSGVVQRPALCLIHIMHTARAAIEIEQGLI